MPTVAFALRRAPAWLIALASLAASACAHSPRPLNPRALELQRAGVAALDAGQLDRAAGAFSLALEYEPRLAEAESGLGLVALARGDKARARTQFQRALAINDDLAEAHHNLGWLDYDRGELDGALEHFRQALAVDPGYPAARLGAGQTLLALGRADEARWELQKLALAAPEDASAQATLALALARLGHLSGAEAAVRVALDRSPTLPMAHRARAEILRARGDLPAALGEIRTVLAAEPGSVADRVWLATTLALSGALDEADQEAAGLVEAAPRHAEAWFLLAYVELQRGNAARAAEAARRALGLRTRFPEARLVLADAARSAGDERGARAALRAFLDEAPPSMREARDRAEALLAQRPGSL